MTNSISTPVMEVIRPGIQSSLQDLGRIGYQSLGIAESGAMDSYSLVQANRLLNNPDGAACLEITLVGPKIQFLRSSVFALTGADLSASLEGQLLETGSAYRAEGGEVLNFGTRRAGVRAYVAVPGGFDAPITMGSRSTYVYAGFGGIHGRALTKGDVLSCRSGSCKDVELAALPERFLLPPDGPRTLRVITGPQEDRFAQAGVETFFGSVFKVTTESNRMGYRLDGPRIEHSDGPIVVSESTPVGAVQVPGQGRPVLLLRERGTTGGYTKIACIITTDIDLVAQTPPGYEIRFMAVRLDQAHSIDRERWQKLDAWRPSNKSEV